MQSGQGVLKGDALQRITGIGFVVGAIGTLVGNAIFPRSDDPSSVTSRMAEIGGDETLAVIAALAIVVGFWALLIGAVGVYRSVTSAMAAPWARLGFYFVLVGTAVATVSFGTLLGAVESSADWVAAGSPLGTTDFVIAASLDALSLALFNVVIVIYWLGLLALGIGALLSGAYPKLLAWPLIVLAAAVVVIGIPRFFTDLTETTELVFAIPAGLTSIWALVAGVWVVRKAW